MLKQAFNPPVNLKEVQSPMTKMFNGWLVSTKRPDSIEDELSFSKFNRMERLKSHLGAMVFINTDKDPKALFNNTFDWDLFYPLPNGQRLDSSFDLNRNTRLVMIRFKKKYKHLF